MTHLSRTLNEYMKSGADIREGDAECAKGLLEAENSLANVLALDPLVSQAFLRIDRVFTSSPVSLYGQDAASLAHNRISIHFGKTDPETGERVPGEAILTALISEEGLNNLLMNQNRGETGACMTAETAMGYDLGPYEPSRHDFRSIFEEMLEDESDRHDSAIDALIARMRSAKAPWGARQSMEISQSMINLAGEGNLSFVLSRYLENLENQRVQTQVEAAHTALHLHSVMSAINAGRLLPAPERHVAPSASIKERSRSNPILNALRSTYDEEEADLLSRAARHSMKRLSTAMNVPDYDPLKDTHGIGFGRMVSSAMSGRDAGEKDRVEAYGKFLCGLINRCENPFVTESVRRSNPWQMSGGITQVSGHYRGFHSDFSRLDNGYFRLYLTTSTQDISYGNPKVRQGDSLLEIGITRPELMTAFRGHPTGDFTRCTLLRLSGRAVPLSDYKNSFDREVEDAPRPPRHEEEKRSIILALKEIDAQISRGVKTSAERDIVVAGLVDLRPRLSAYKAASVRTTRAMADTVENMVDRDMREMLTRISDAVGDVSEILSLK